jgi:hypothetical protein
MRDLLQPLVLPKRRFFSLHPVYYKALLLPFGVFVLGAIAQVGLLLWGLAYTGWTPEAFVLVIWSVVPLLGVFSLVWNLFGREVVTLVGDSLSTRREILGVGRTKRFGRHEIQHPHTRPLTRREIQDCCWGIGVGKVRFTVAHREHSFGIGLTDDEAQAIAKQLEEWAARNAQR